MQSFRAAAVQICAGTDKDANLARAEALVAEAAALSVRLVVLPEVFSWRGTPGDESSGAERIPGPTSTRCAGWARHYGVYLLAGSILERVTGEARTFNTSLLFDDRGELLGRYRKAHLFDVDIPGHVKVRESDARLAGDDVVVITTALGKIGLSVCYDLRFPELYRRLTMLGAEIVCIPSAFTFPTGAAHWEPLLRARAIENQVYVVAPNQVGRTPRNTMDFGHSMIVDPWGAILATASDRESVIAAEIDLDYQARVRRELPCLSHIKFAR